ncbi:coiled-coil domain-containing protein [Nocardiopsis sp. NPDC006938]|uniref:coiled-coil domain-containing protein n=1 Tax=Nocardiopsis sp. NPDC006938 TaxID=3364337 RepID=UPI003695005B
MQFEDTEQFQGAAQTDGHADFWAPDPPSRTRGEALADLAEGARALGAGALSGLASAAPPRGTRIAALCLSLVAATALPLLPASAAPAPGAPPREPESMSDLKDRAAALTEEFEGELRDMEAVMEEAERAGDRADATREEVEDARDQVVSLAVATYTSGGIDPAMSLFVEAEPDEVIDRAVVIDYLSTTNQEKIDHLNQALSRDEVAQRSAQERLDEASEDMDELEERRSEVHVLIADHPNQPMQPHNSITPRTEQMRDLVIERFGRGDDVGGVGCYRPDGGWVVGEHPKGRACDFMLHPNGGMPDQEQIDRGWEISEWARENADDLGIMYVIYRQQIWDVRRGDEGWRAMSDRGNMTENHFDHVHISMF